MEKIWLKHYPEGVPENIDPDSYASIVDMFEQSCNRFSTRPAISNFGCQLTYGQLEEKSRHIAAYFQKELGLKKGDRIALMMPNIMQYVACIYGALRAGLVIVNVNPLYTARELAYLLSDAQVETIVVMSNFASVVQKVLRKTSLKNIIVTELGDLFPYPKSTIANFIVKRVKKMIPRWHIDGVKTFAQVMKRGKQLTLTNMHLQGDDIAFLQYTGGTTGRAKGAMLSHRNMVANILQGLELVSLELIEGRETVIVALPLYHIFSLTVCSLCFMKLGGHAVLITNPRDIDHFVKEMSKTTFSVFIGLNTLFNALLHNADFKKIDFRHLKMTIAGGMAVQYAIAEKWRVATGSWIMEGYGLTEASPVVSLNPPIFKAFNGSVGLPLPSTEACIRNEDNKDAALGEEGELCLKGPQVMQGYWHAGEETEKAYTPDGWLKTGDIAFMNEKGFIFLVDRKKDMIVVSGFNVYPNEVEEVIASHPDVKEVAVVGASSTRSGEVVKAYVVKRHAEFTKENLLTYCRDQLAAYKVPKQIVFRDELPKSNVGKVLRRVLREEG